MFKILMGFIGKEEHLKFCVVRLAINLKSCLQLVWRTRKDEHLSITNEIRQKSETKEKDEFLNGRKSKFHKYLDI